MGAINDAVVHFHVDGQVNHFFRVAVFGIVGKQHSHVVLALAGIPIFADGAVNETIITAKGPNVGCAAIGDDEFWNAFICAAK